MHFLEKVTDEFWWDVASKCEYTTFYHTPIWRELAIRTFPGIYLDDTFAAILPNGVRVVFPLVSTRRLSSLRWLISSFEGCYGGFIADGPVTPAQAIQIYDQVCSWKTSLFRVLDNPLAPPMPEVTRKLSIEVEEETLMVPLDSDFDTIFSRFKKPLRRAYRAGLAKGVQVRVATSLDDYRAYYPNYRDAVDRWGENESYGYNWSLFEHIYKLSQIYPENIKLWLMIVDEQVVGGSIVFYWGQMATAWNGTAHREFLKYQVMPVTDIECIRDASERGFRYFDFNTSALIQGVVDYKKQFAPISVPVNVRSFEGSLHQVARTLKVSLHRSRSYVGQRLGLQQSWLPSALLVVNETNILQLCGAMGMV